MKKSIAEVILDCYVIENYILHVQTKKLSIRTYKSIDKIKDILQVDASSYENLLVR